MSDAVEVDQPSYDAILKRLKKAEPAVVEGANQGLFLAAQDILTEAKQRVPVDTGTLRSTGVVIPETPQLGNPDPEYVVSFGGPAAPYAIIQHERTDLHHAEGGPKYLEGAYLNQVDGLREKVKAAVWDALKKAVG